ncbi:hypothetical protein D3C81_1127620 [compost metagenome]
MAVRVRAHLHAGRMQLAQLRRAQHGGRTCQDARLAAYPHGQLLAPGERQVFELPQQGGDGSLPLRQAGDGERPQLVFAQVQHGTWRMAHGVDHRVVPHLPAVQVARGDEKRGVHAMALQQRQGDLRIVRIAVVEGDAGGALRQVAILQALHGIAQR